MRTDSLSENEWTSTQKPDDEDSYAAMLCRLRVSIAEHSLPFSGCYNSSTHARWFEGVLLTWDSELIIGLLIKVDGLGLSETVASLLHVVPPSRCLRFGILQFTLLEVREVVRIIDLSDVLNTLVNSALTDSTAQFIDVLAIVAPLVDSVQNAISQMVGIVLDDERIIEAIRKGFIHIRIPLDVEDIDPCSLDLCPVHGLVLRFGSWGFVAKVELRWECESGVRDVDGQGVNLRAWLYLREP